MGDWVWGCGATRVAYFCRVTDDESLCLSYRHRVTRNFLSRTVNDTVSRLRD